jgi:tetratricopeptide (TPR) repeat protein
MKKKFLRAALVASLSMFAVGTFLATSSAVAASEQPEKPKISKAISKQMSDAQKALQAKDWPTAIAKCKEAEGIADTTDYDKFMIQYFLGFAYFNSGDKKSAGEAYATAAHIPNMPADDHSTTLHNALLLAADQNDYKSIVDLGQIAVKENQLDHAIAGEMAIAYYNLNDLPNAASYAQKSIDLATAAGKTPDRAAYQVLVFCQNKQKDIAGETKTFEQMANLYGNVDDWGHLIDLSLATLSTASKQYREIAALDLYRLRVVTGATSVGEDYKAMADAATILHSPGDARTALKTAVSKGVLTQGQVNAALAKASADAARDEPILAQAEAAAAKQKSADEDMSVGEAYFGYGRYADAARVAQRAIAKGGARTAEAKLLLGMCQVQQGDNTTGAQTLSSVDGDPAMDRVGHLWTLYATRKYGAAPATPAAAH